MVFNTPAIDKSKRKISKKTYIIILALLFSPIVISVILGINDFSHILGHLVNGVSTGMFMSVMIGSILILQDIDRVGSEADSKMEKIILDQGIEIFSGESIEISKTTMNLTAKRHHLLFSCTIDNNVKNKTFTISGISPLDGRSKPLEQVFSDISTLTGISYVRKEHIASDSSSSERETLEELSKTISALSS